MLTTTVLDAEPEQVVTLPAHSLWPLGLALAIALLLFGALVDALTVGLLGAGGAAVALLGWSWSRQDLPHGPAAGGATPASADALAPPAAVGPPPAAAEPGLGAEHGGGAERVAARSTSWWGAAMTVGVLASMLSTVVFAALYLRAGAAADLFLPAEGEPGLAAPALVVLLALASVVPVAFAHRAVRLRDGRRLQLGSALGGLLGAGVLLAAGLDLATVAFRWDTSAYGSVHWLAVGFHGLTTLAGVGMLGYCQVHVWRGGPGALEARARDAAAATALLWYYVVVGWVVVYLVLLGVAR